MRDTTAWSLSLAALAIFCLPVLLGAGIARGWNVSLTTQKYQFTTVVDSTRFWPEPNAFEENAELDSMIPGRNFSSASSTWYYWKLRPSGFSYCHPEDFDPVTEPHVMSCNVPQSNAGTKAFVWSCYLLHQCVIWALTYKAQRLHKNDTNYHSHLRWYNIASFFANGAFYVLHLIQTHTTYDAIAQDVTEASSQASVILLLVMVLIMEYKSRGLLLGWPASTDPANACCRQCSNGCSWRLPASPVELVRKYHGYAFSWATIFTLWYHPMESTAAHVSGFFHTGMLLIQQSLMFTPMHLNKYWRLTLEIWVAIHGAITAAQTQGKGMIGMFLFGFLWMTVFTQIHGLPYYLAFVEKSNSANHVDQNNEEGDSERGVRKPSTYDQFYRYVPSSRWKRWLVRLAPVAVYFIVVIASYQTWLNRGDQSLGVQITEIVRIPLILYLMAVFVAIIGWGMLTSSNAICKCCEKTEKNVVSIAEKDEERNSGESEESEANKPLRSKVGSLGPGTVLAILFIVYACMVAISVVFEQIHVQMNLILLMVILVAIFTVCALFVMIIMEKDMKRIELGPPQLPLS